MVYVLPVFGEITDTNCVELHSHAAVFLYNLKSALVLNSSGDLKRLLKSNDQTITAELTCSSHKFFK